MADCELKTIEKCSSDLEIALKVPDRTLVHSLCNEGFYSDEICDKILDPCSNETERSGELVKWIKNRIKQEPESYRTFVSHLKQGGKLYQPIVRKLEQECTRQQQGQYIILK